MHFLYCIGKFYIRGIFICNITSIPLSYSKIIKQNFHLSCILGAIYKHGSYYAPSFMLKHFSERSVTSHITYLLQEIFYIINPPLLVNFAFTLELMQTLCCFNAEIHFFSTFSFFYITPCCCLITNSINNT